MIKIIRKTGINPEKVSNGVTLIEVLTVLVLISLLMALVLPIYSHSAWWISQTRQSMAASNYAYSLLEGIRAQADDLDWARLSAREIKVPEDWDLGVAVSGEFEAYIRVVSWLDHDSLYKAEVRIVGHDVTGITVEKNMITLIMGAKD